MTVVRHQLFPQKPPGLRLNFSRTGVQPSPGSSTIELPSYFAESGAYPPDRALQGSPRQYPLPLACRHPPERCRSLGTHPRLTFQTRLLHNQEGVNAEKGGFRKTSSRAFFRRIGRCSHPLGCGTIEPGKSSQSRGCAKTPTLTVSKTRKLRFCTSKHSSTGKLLM